MELGRVRADDCPRREAQCGETSEQRHIWLRQSSRGCEKSNRGDAIGWVEDRTEEQSCQQAAILAEGLGVLDVQVRLIDDQEAQSALLGRVEHSHESRRMVDQKLWRREHKVGIFVRSCGGVQELKELLVLLSVVPKRFVKVERAHSTVLLVGTLKLGKKVSRESQERDKNESEAHLKSTQ